jgi:hypothetical protein
MEKWGWREGKKEDTPEYETRGYMKSQLIETTGTYPCHLIIIYNTVAFSDFNIPESCDLKF